MNIVTIGYLKFAVRKPADAAALIRIMAEVMPVDSIYRDNREGFYPAAERDRNRISLEMVSDNQFLVAKPADNEPVENFRPAPFRRGLRITGPSIKTPGPK